MSGVAAGSAGEAAWVEKRATMANAERILSAIDFLSSHRDDPLEELASRIGTRLQRDQAASNDVFAVYKGVFSADMPFARIELRKPIDVTKRTGFIILDLRKGKNVECVVVRDAITRYGQPVNVEVPKPEQGDDAPISWIFHRPWGELWMAFARGGEPCLASVSIRWPQ